MVYSTVCSEREPTPVDFTPLRVDYFARYRFVCVCNILSMLLPVCRGIVLLGKQSEHFTVETAGAMMLRF